MANKKPRQVKKFTTNPPVPGAYPYWKELAFRFVRTAIWGGISTAVAVQVVLAPDFSNIEPYAVSMTVAFLSGFLTTLAKAIRDYTSDFDKTELIQKLPL